MIPFILYFQKAKTIGLEKSVVAGVMGWGWIITQGEHEGVFWDDNSVYPDCGESYTN